MCIEVIRIDDGGELLQPSALVLAKLMYRDVVVSTFEHKILQAGDLLTLAGMSGAIPVTVAASY